MNEQTLFRAAHRRLTLLCAGITAAILCLFSCLYLLLAEQTLRDSQWNAFRQDMANLASSLEQQTVITHVYLSGLEQNNGYQIYLWDQDMPFRFNEVPHHTLSLQTRELLLSYLPGEDALSRQETADSHKSRTLPTGETCSLLSSGEDWVILHLKAGQGREYQVYLARLTIGQPSAHQLLTAPRTPGITMLVASSRQNLSGQFWGQRLRFLLIDLAGILLLTLFAHFFTGRMLRPLLESHRRQTRFIADASHELRTPLAVIRACMHARPPAYEQTIDQECAHMGRLIEDLLTLSRLETAQGQGNLLPEGQDVDLDTLLLNVYEQMELLAAQKKIQLKLQLPQDPLPHVKGDPHKLEQLLVILLQNALSYTQEGGKVTLAAELSRPSEAGKDAGTKILKQKHRQAHTGDVSTVYIRVTDNGPGIPEADKTHIFERFYRAQRSRTDRSHFGLGLCIAQEIAQAHGASLAVTDTEGGGATFGFTLRAPS